MLSPFAETCPWLVTGAEHWICRYYRDTNDTAILVEHGFSREWADCASKLVLQEADNPQEDSIVALINLAHFWYSQGAWRRFYMHKCEYFQAQLLPFLS